MEESSPINMNNIVNIKLQNELLLIAKVIEENRGNINTTLFTVHFYSAY